MSRIPHHLHIYEKPARVNGGVADLQIHHLSALNYRHKISANGGFDTASCDVNVDRAEAEFIFGSLVGNRVAVYADNPVLPAWEGFISRVTIMASGVERSRSLEDMANRVVVQFTDGALDMTQTGEVTNAASIATFGSKMKHFDAGEMYADATTFAQAMRDARLAQLAYPPVSAVSGGGANYRVSIEMLGFFHTLTWDTFEVIDTGTVSNAPAEILLDGTGDDYSYNYGIFYNDTDASRIQSTGWSINNSRQLGESSWDLLLRIAEAGNNGNRRIVGISETSPNTGSRIAYYENANETVEYITYAYGDGRLFNTSGQEINPWDVRPNRSIRLNDILIGQPDGASDAKTAYITSVEYDAENGSVSWITDNNPTLEGVFNLEIESRPTNERFGAERRSAMFRPLSTERGGTGVDNSTGADGQLLVRGSANGNFVPSGHLLSNEANDYFGIGVSPTHPLDIEDNLSGGDARNMILATNSNTGTGAAVFSTVQSANSQRTQIASWNNTYTAIASYASRGGLQTDAANGMLIIASAATPFIHFLVAGNSIATNIAMSISSNKNISMSGNLAITGSLSKGSGTFDIDHPADPANKHLRHSFVESPEGLLVYRGEARLVDGTATVDIDQVFGMTPGTFTLLTRKAQVANLCCPFDFERVRIDPAHAEAIHSGILYIEAQDKKSAAVVSWVVMAERNDAFWRWCDLTDDDGNFVVEYDKPDAPDDLFAEREDSESEDDYDEVVEGEYKGFYRHPAAHRATNPSRIRRVRGAKPKEKPKDQVRKTDD